MKNTLLIAALLGTLGFGTLLVQAQEAPNVVSASQAFAAIQPDMQGTVTQPILHAPAGDVLAVYVGHAPKQVYTKQDELFYVISGHGTASVGYPSYQVGPGSVISVPRSTAFEITANGSAPLKAILIASPSDNPADKKILEPGTTQQ